MGNIQDICCSERQDKVYYINEDQQQCQKPTNMFPKQQYQRQQLKEQQFYSEIYENTQIYQNIMPDGSQYNNSLVKKQQLQKQQSLFQNFNTQISTNNNSYQQYSNTQKKSPQQYNLSAQDSQNNNSPIETQNSQQSQIQNLQILSELQQPSKKQNIVKQIQQQEKDLETQDNNILINESTQNFQNKSEIFFIKNHNNKENIKISNQLSNNFDRKLEFKNSDIQDQEQFINEKNNKNCDNFSKIQKNQNQMWIDKKEGSSSEIFYSFSDDEQLMESLTQEDKCILIDQNKDKISSLNNSQIQSYCNKLNQSMSKSLFQSEIYYKNNHYNSQVIKKQNQQLSSQDLKQQIQNQQQEEQLFNTSEQNQNVSQLKQNQEQIEQEGFWMFEEESQLFQQSQNNHLFEENKLQLTDKKIVIQLYSLMRIVDQLFIKNNVPYWVCFGTALGCIRHKGIIPWDDDLDIGMKVDDEQNFLDNIVPQLQQNKLQISKVDFGYKIYNENSKLIKNTQEQYENYRYPFLDIFIYQKFGKKWMLKDKPTRQTCKHYDIYKDSQLNNLQRADFGNFQVNLAPNMDQYLQIAYGENWKTQAKTHFWNHTQLKVMTPQCFTLTSDLLDPAKPFE
ncbi:hypothetical protein PPERSA_02331 [Pseudocohnilembus persalinus]|uniref:LicD/FKTN/FKRP nucleotidyltransferase domain-containing protein n=1 Tax=Pseudocohnilembus persalinus TaxID=266149 RepID=A0A0V0QUA6_PSEPJ|nr:hypothetical protein PPERSA_02331 [Pseudocohnilembus persalinus]|eukprot:KRX05799.1 hypothetical protein PPERSA_02331 [Pseudocohnilembus persalinus]